MSYAAFLLSYTRGWHRWKGLRLILVEQSIFIYDRAKYVMSVIEILETAQYVVDKDGQETAVLLDLASWTSLRHLLEELIEDENLGQLMMAVENDEKLTGNAARRAYNEYLAEAQSWVGVLITPVPS